MRFRDHVAAEFARRRQLNPRYSLRGFARALGVHHATLSRLLGGTQPLQSRTILTLAPRLGVPAPQIVRMLAAEDAAAVMHGVTRPSFRPDCRWLASVTGLPVDRINIALHTLIRDRRLRMVSAHEWSVTQS